MDVTYAHLCDYASVSREGKLSVMGIFSNINLSELPGQHPIAYLAFEMELHPAEMDRESSIEVDIVDADGGSIFKMEGKFKGSRRGKPGEIVKIGQIIALKTMAFQRDGAYQINIFLNNHRKRTVDFTVTIPPEGQQGADSA